MTPLACAGEQRREVVRQHTRLNGFDYLEVGTDRRILSVHFLGKSPVSLEPGNLVIDGGRRIRDIKVVRVTLYRTAMPGLDDTMEVVTDREGDSSEYVLRAVERDEQGAERPHPSFDPHYDRVAFTFKADCPSDLDCKQDRVCPPEPRDEPEINYLAKDYASFRQLMLDRLALVMPEWRERHVPDLGIAVVEVLAYVGDHLSYYQDAVATEAYIGTARQRISVRRHARLVDYSLHEGCNARTWVCVQTDGAVTLEPARYLVHYADSGPGAGGETGRAGTVGGRPVRGLRANRRSATSSCIRASTRFTSTPGATRSAACSRGSTTATLIGRWIEEPSPSEPPCDPPQRRAGGRSRWARQAPPGVRRRPAASPQPR